MKMVDIDSLLTGPEIAFLAGVKQVTIERWKLKNQRTPSAKVLPEPLYIGSMPVWKLETITDWLDQHEMRYDVKAWRKARTAGEFRRKTPPNAKAVA